MAKNTIWILLESCVIKKYIYETFVQILTLLMHYI